MNRSLLILLTGGFLTIVSQLIQLTYKYKNDQLKPTDHTNKPDPIDTNTKNAYIANYCMANGLDRMDWIDQKIYRNKYYEIDILCYSIDQLYTVAKYGKWEKSHLSFFIVWIVRIFKLFELSEYSNCLNCVHNFELSEYSELFNYENFSHFWHNDFSNNCPQKVQTKNLFNFIIVSKNKTIQNI